MSTRNFDSRVIVERLQNRNHARYTYEARARGQNMLPNPQTSNGNASMATLYQDGIQTVYDKGLLGGAYTIQQGGNYGIPLYIEPQQIIPPGKPSLLTISGGDQTLTVFFIEPVNTGGAPILHYEYSLDNGITYADTMKLSSPFVITGLSNGINYTVTLRARNTAGPGALSDGVQGMPISTPAAPINIASTAGNQQLSISFTLGSDGGSPITNYQYSITNGASYVTVSPPQTISPIIITGLVNGTTYSVKIRAINNIGFGEPSQTVTGTPGNNPSAPTLLSTLSSDSSVYVYFTAGSNGGSPITNYEYSLDTETSWNTIAPSDPFTPVLISGLINGTSYTVVLRAVNAVGVSSASNAITFIPVLDTIPSAVLYYNPNDLSSYSGSGSSVVNIGSGGVLTGTKSGAVTYQVGTGISRNIFNMTGTGYIAFGQYQFGGAFTVSGWVYPRDKSSINALIANAGSGQQPSGFKLGWNNWNANNLTMLYEGGNGSQGNSQSTLNNVVVYNQWQMLTYLVDTVNNLVFFLLNGVPVDTATYSNNIIVANVGTNNTAFRIGTFTDGSYGMNAELGELKIYTGLKSVSAIRAEYEATKSSFGL